MQPKSFRIKLIKQTKQKLNRFYSTDPTRNRARSTKSKFKKKTKNQSLKECKTTMSRQCVKVCLETIIYFHICLPIIEYLCIRSCAFIYINISKIRKVMFAKRNRSCYKRSLSVFRTTTKYIT